MRDRRQPQRGETLVGLMVGMALGLLVLTAGAHMLAQLLRGHHAALQDSHLQQDLHFALDAMVRDIRNAQYVAKAWTSRSPGVCSDPFCGVSDFQLADNLIAFSTDRDDNGKQDNNECMGFRAQDGVLSVRTSCDSGGWQPLTDKTTVIVTGLKAQLHCSKVAGWLMRQLDVRLEAHWPNQPTHTLQLQRSVALRNPLPAALQTRFCP